MKTEIDALDKHLVNSIRECPGQKIRAVIKPFFGEKSESVLRTRILQLELRKLIRLEKSPKGPIQCYPAAEEA